MHIKAIAFISPQSTPIYIRSYPADTQADLTHSQHAFAALDYVDRSLANTAAVGVGKEGYLGLLIVLDQLALYGYKPSSNITILLSFQLESQPIRDSDVLTVFHALHQAYLLTISNPFHPQPLSSDPSSTERWEPKRFEQSKRLESRLEDIVTRLGSV